MKLYLFSLILILSTTICFSQENSNDSKFYFLSYFHKESNVMVQDSLKLEIDSLNSLLFNQGNARYQIDTNANWELISHSRFDWEHVVGQKDWLQESIEITILDTSRMGIAMFNDTIIHNDTSIIPSMDFRFHPHFSWNSLGKKYFLLKNKVTFSGRELYRFLVKHYQYPQNLDSTSIKKFPIIVERHDPLNHRYIPIMSNNILVLRYVHSYPDGNTTSWYHEQVYYFRKTKLDGY